MFGTAYVTSEEFIAAAFGFDVSDLPVGELDSTLANASRLAEQYAGVIWAEDSYTEQQTWRAWSRRVYLRHWPVLALISARLWIGANLYATLTITDFVVNNAQHYIELADLASSVVLTSELVTLGLSEPIIEVTYRAGYGQLVDSEANLAEDLDAAETAWQTTDGTKFSQYDKIRIDQETALVVDIVGDVLTVVRDAPTAIHGDGADIFKLQSTAPDEVKLAVVIIAAALIAQHQLAEEGLAGVRSFVIGTYSVTVGKGDGEAAGFAGLIPDAAKMLLGRRSFAYAR